MQKLKGKTIAIAIGILLTFSMLTSMMLIPSAKAHSPPFNIQTYAFVNVAPDPAGVGQTVTVGFWIDQPPPTANGPYGDRWQNITVKVTKPDGNSETLGPFVTDDTGGTNTLFTPSEVGNYTFQMIFPGQTLLGSNPAPTGTSNAVWVGDYYEPSTSNVYTLTVQQQPASGSSVTPLPTNYWQTPVTALNANLWYTITGSWLGFGASTFATTGMYNFSGNYNPYTLAPKTAHIIWTKPEAFGGLLGGEFGGTETSNYYSTSQYEPKFAPVIINGILYYTSYPGSSNYPAGIVAVNLYSGQTLFTINTTLALRCGQILDYQSPNQYGGFAYLWTTGTLPGMTGVTGTQWNMYDATTGNYVLSVVNGTSMSLTEDSGGDLIGYYVNATVGSQIVNGQKVTNPAGGVLLEEWNSTRCVINSFYGASAAGWEWRPTLNGKALFSNGLTWAVPLPTSINGAPIGTLGLSSINSGVILMSYSNATGQSVTSGQPYFQPGWIVFAGLSSSTGQLLWIANQTQVAWTRPVYAQDAGSGVYVVFSPEDGSCVGYSLLTGKQLWTLRLPVTNSYDSFSYQYVPANGVIYAWGLGGDVWAINVATGTLLWHTTTLQITGSSGAQTPYGVWPLWTFTDGAVADGELFIPEGHMYSPPLFHGAQQLALNITTGQSIWSISAFDVTSAPAIAYGIATTINAYDNQIYAWGMGPSKTTVTAPNVGVTTSTPITITGSVTDISAGAQQQAVAANFPNGLPCVSDASMTQFMEAVYEQQPMPTNLTGVPVTLYVLDSNGNYRSIGTTTTNAHGTYGLTWKPDIPGNYTVTATFAGTNAYYGSSASTAFYASAAAPTPAPTATPLSLASTQNDIMYVGIAIIIVIVIIGALILVTLNRKRP
ncbi:MAG: PQQ-binding-like beta-propeller repeat protein [Candidatus Bathyarchaeia archaeon]|jgi:outer membrane protein assembly factor BamB